MAAIPAFAALTVGARVARAFDAGIPQAPLLPGQIACTGAADCPAGQICLNGVCSNLPGSSTETAVGGGSEPTPTPRSISTSTETPAAGTPTAEATTTPTSEASEATTTPAVGGETNTGNTLTAGIFSGRCGALGGDATYPLIDIGAGSANGAAATPPAGAPEGATSDFSATVLNAKLDSFVDGNFAVDLRTNPKDPSTSVACGDLAGPIDTSKDKPELVTELGPIRDSDTSGVSWLRAEGDRTLAYVFVKRPETTGTSDQAQSVTAATPTATASSFADGDTLLTLTDVNLRAQPTTGAEIVQILGTGEQLQATGPDRDGWAPVRDEATGATGFVSTDLVEKQS